MESRQVTDTSLLLRRIRMSDIRLSPETALPLIIESIKQNGSCRVVVTGNSMFPFLHHKEDTVILSELTDPPKKGDILFYTRPSGQCVLHRVMKADGDPIIFCGDAHYLTEPVRREKLVAKAIAVDRGKKVVSFDSFRWRFISRLWIGTLPIRPFLMRIIYHFTPSGRKLLKPSKDGEN